MSNIRKLPPELGMLLSMLGIAKQISVEIDPDSPLSEDEQVQAAVDKAAAKHREECAGCREEYEREQVAAATSVPVSNTDKERRQGQVDRRVQGNPVGNAGRAAATYFGDKATGETNAPDRRIVGYMAYAGDTPIIGTFDEEHDVVVGGVIEFTNGVTGSGIVVKPVFG